MKYLIRYLIDFVILAFLYGSVLFKKWRAEGRDVLLVNTLMYLYLSLVLCFTMMPVVTSIPFILNHPYKPMLGYIFYMIFRPVIGWILGRLRTAERGR